MRITGPRNFIAEKDNGSLNAARDHGWVVVSMNDDWNVIYSFKK